MDRQRQNDKL